MSDKEIGDLIDGERDRQARGLELIPSENYVSKDVLAALGSELTNKYCEGYPGRRYYGGQEFTDQIETLAIERAKKLFRADHANVQSHSGAQANEAVYHAWLDPGDTVLAMDLSHGGHLTHGHPVTVLSKQFNFVRYKTDLADGSIDYEEVRRLAHLHKPKIILAGFSAYPRTLDYEKFAEIGNEVGAVLMADMSHIAGLIAGGVAANPLDYGFHVMTTTTHKSLRGPRGGLILSMGTVSNPLKAPEKTIENLPTLIDRTVFPGIQGGPLMNVIAAKAVAFYEALDPSFSDYAKRIVANAKALADSLSDRGFSLVTGGTDNHLILIDINKSFGIDGKIAEDLLDSIGLTMNKNSVPDDTLPPFRPSGLRLGTPAVTTRGLGVDDMTKIADWMRRAIDSRDDDKILETISHEIKDLCLRHPVPTIDPT